MAVETGGARLTAGQLREAGLPVKIISWLRVNRWEASERESGTGTEDFILVAPTNGERIPLVVQIYTWRDPADKVIVRRDFKLWLEKPAVWNDFDRRPLVEIMDACPDDNPKVTLSVSKPIPTPRGKERWLQIQEPTVETDAGLERLKQHIILVNPTGTEWQEIITGHTPRWDTVRNP